MSGSDSASASLSRVPSPSKVKAEHFISLVDHTISRTPSIHTDTERYDSDTPLASAAAPPGLYHKLTNNSLRQTVRSEYNKQKYAKYGQDRYHGQESSQQSVEDVGKDPAVGESTTAAQKSYLERAQTRARQLLKRKRTLGKGDADNTVVDVLYENQRGYFFFGIPKYSSASLLPMDPKPWQNGQFRTSAVDIRNAQVPDPSWEWAWKSWYVDMSRDVDEEGWEYSLAFVGPRAATFAWHGNHPWFHSFVRRRRWLRMRRRKDSKHHTKEKSHEMAEDYFTIHPRTMRPGSPSEGASSTFAQALNKLRDPVVDIEKMEISNIGDLFLALRKSTVDREKIHAIKKFIDEGGEELQYLSDRMGDIMGTLMFQSSRRQLLSDLMSLHEDAHKTQKELAAHEHEDDDAKQADHDRSKRRAENLLKAVYSADALVKKLEFWSDIKEIGDATTAAEMAEEGHDLPSFKNKQEPSAAANGGTEHLLNGKDDGNKTAYETAVEAPTKKHTGFSFETESKKSKGKGKMTDADSELDRYTTASEAPSEMTSKSKTKGKGKALGLDGVAEEEGEERMVHKLTGTRGDRRSVQIVDPVSEDMNGGDDDEEGFYDADEADSDEYSPRSLVDRGEAKTPDSIAGFMKEIRKPKNWAEQAFGGW
ncbi:Meiotically up-regulated 65 [Lecanosticta acicola]|uniref:Meiotically up-regulated 65 n=1 Tax=Lecanosticta acicola TaxID=111012 RepID=A0AAI8W0D2_9PEZI|nr:Meiotically up-regulated 65 [Lecanosticta acicola]